MNCLTKLISFVIIFVLCITGIAFLGQYSFNRYAPDVIDEWGAKLTDFKFDLDYIHLDLLDSSFSVKDFDISNPDAWKDSDFFSLNEATCDFSLKNSTRERLYFDRLALDVKELTLVINEDGKANWTELMKKFKKDSAEEEETTKEPVAKDETASDDTGEKMKLPTLYIKQLVLGLEKIEIVDYSRTPTWRRSYNVGMHIDLKDVDKIEDLIEPISKQLLASGGASALPMIYKALGNDDAGKQSSKDLPLSLLNGLLGK